MQRFQACGSTHLLRWLQYCRRSHNVAQLAAQRMYCVTRLHGKPARGLLSLLIDGPGRFNAFHTPLRALQVGSIINFAAVYLLAPVPAAPGGAAG